MKFIFDVEIQENQRISIIPFLSSYQPKEGSNIDTNYGSGKYLYGKILQPGWK